MSDIQWWVWVLIALVVVAVIAAAVAMSRTARRKKEQARIEHDEHQREKAALLREDARLTSVDIKRREAESLAAAADAEEARLAADELERKAAEHREDADRTRDAVDDRLLEADRIDPDVQPDADGDRRA
ncbi:MULTISPECIES: hypothetical protein [Aeromicrobium]|uniref:hypothetical protein n=1 Tax=Aeromicrobium TaxID=2040 RepID=UPI000701827E|nr:MULTISPECIES: hypothetical protein [Aeromicrobium]KQX74553.1 hypothetical protein ASD10_04805 [Aeromicrobium sp. Root472D3]MCL8249962.1 hypothetical protein [Aeromicrobium fastidiosum]